MAEPSPRARIAIRLSGRKALCLIESGGGRVRRFLSQMSFSPLVQKFNNFSPRRASCFADKKSRHRGAENERVFRCPSGKETEAVACVEAVACAGAFQWILAERALCRERAIRPRADGEPQLVNDYR